MKIDINGVKITLTEEQLAEISRQTNKRLKVEDINSLEDAELVLKDCKSHQRTYESQFPNLKYWNIYQLETIIKAINFIDNNYQEWIPNFNNSNEYKYIPYFEKKKNGWFFCDVNCYFFSSGFSVGLFYMKESSAKLLSNKFKSLYDNVLNG